jgi:hypothetical protein
MGVEEMQTKKTAWKWILLFCMVFSAGCAVPVREAFKVDRSLPLGKIEGNQFIGVRFPFKVSAPPGWKITTKYPEFMVDLGYDKEGLEESQVFIFDPDTQSNLQIDFEAADRYTVFNQSMIEGLTTAATGSLIDELEADYGKGLKPKIGPTKPIHLKGVPYAAEKYAVYTLKGVERQQGWVYAFAQPYQIFILYLVLEKEGKIHYGAIKEILDSFEYLPK